MRKALFVLFFALFAAAVLAPSYAGASASELEVKSLAEDQSLSFQDAAQSLEEQKRAPALQKRADRALGDSFGGVWVDNADGATVKLGVVDGEQGAVAEAQGAIQASGTGAEIVLVRHSFAELEGVAQWLSSQIKHADSGPVSEYPLITGIATNENTVVLKAPADARLSPAEIALIKAAETRFDPSILRVTRYSGPLSERGCTWPYCDPPLRGGNRLLYNEIGGKEGEGLEGLCTGGFSVRGKTTGNLYLATAGHCDILGKESVLTKTPATGKKATIGPFYQSINNYLGDVGLISITSPAYWTARPWVYVKGGKDIGANQQYPILGDARSVVGMQVCINGGFTTVKNKEESDCGPVWETNVSYGGEGNWTYAEVCAEYGDSGSPIFAGNIAYGLLTHGEFLCNNYYMEIQPAESLLNFEVVHTTQKPTVQTTAATGVGSSTAWLNGTINPEESSTTYKFEYGPTIGYGSVAPVPSGSVGTGSTAIAVNQFISGFQPNTTYHYRLVATNGLGTTQGLDQELTTGPTVVFPDASNNNSLTLWNRDNSTGWKQTFLFGHPASPGSSASSIVVNGLPYIFFSDDAENDSTTVWTWNSTAGWQQTFLYGHKIAAGTSPAAISINGEPHMFYVDADRGNQISEWAWNGVSGWQQSFLSTDAVAAGSSPAPIIVNGETRVFFSSAAASRTLAVLKKTGASWEQVRFYGDSMTAGSSPAPIYDPGGATKIFYSDSTKGNTLSSWNWSPSGLSQSYFGGDPITAGSSPAVIVNGNATQIFVSNAAKSNTISAWTWAPTLLTLNHFYGHSLAAGTSPVAIKENGTVRVFFTDATNANSISNWEWNPTTLVLFPLWGHPVMTGASPRL